MTIIRVLLVLLVVDFIRETSPAISRPPLRRELTFNTNPAPIWNQVQAQVVRLENNSFAVINAYAGSLSLTIFTSNWTQSESFWYPLSVFQLQFLVFSGPSNTVIFITEQFVTVTSPFYGLVIFQRLLKFDTQGQVLVNSSLMVVDGNINKVGCRVNEDFMALGLGGAYATAVNPPLVLHILNNDLISVYNKTFINGKYINMASDGTYLYTIVQFATLTSVSKIHPSNWSIPIATYNTSKLPTDSTPSFALVGDSLVISRSKNAILQVIQLTTSTLAELIYTDFPDATGNQTTLKYPAYSNDGYFLFPSKLKTNGSWIEYPMEFKNGKILPQPVSVLWTAPNPTLAELVSARYYNDMYGNGYIAILTDVDPLTNQTINKLMFFGDVCGDGILSGTAEQCDSGEFCTSTCQCQPGYIPTSPISTQCILDTSFVNCSSCTNNTDASQCDVTRDTCVGFRVAPILLCAEQLVFGSRRAYFSYRSNHTTSIIPHTSNNQLTPYGVTIEEFEYGRLDYYPFYSFFVDYLPSVTTVEWFLDGNPVSFDVSNSSLACPQSLSLLIEALTPTYTQLIQFASNLGKMLAQVMNISSNFVSITTPQNNATQTTMFFRADISYDTINNVAAADAIRTLFVNVTIIFELIIEVRSVRIASLPNEIGEGVITPDDPVTPIAWSPGSIQVPPTSSPVIGPPSDAQPSSGVIDDGPNAPVDNTNPGWSNNYIAAIILVPLAVGAVIFLAVYFARKKQQRATKSALMNRTQFNTPLNELRTDKSLNYSIVPDTPPTDLGTSKYAAMAGIDNKNITDRLRIPYSELVFKKEIGAGAYGKVFIGEWQRTKVALKINTSATGDDFAREARLMVELRPHPNVVQMLGVSSDGPYPVMILEFCGGGSLDDKLFNLNEAITLQQQFEIVLGIAKGLYHLHKNQIVHRDLAARNILLSRDEPKISDFGMSRQVGEQQKGTTKSNVGPIRWMAPESLKQNVYSAKSDVWTFGIVMYEIVAREEPHSKADQMAVGLDIRDNGITPSIPDECDPVLKELMTQCWQMDPEDRPTMEQICDILVKYME